MQHFEKKYECIPQNDLDCYYNSFWKKKYIDNNIDSVSNFSIIESRIDREMYDYIDNLKPSQTDPVINNLIRFRDSYLNSRNNNFIAIINLLNTVKNIKTIDDLTDVVILLNRIGVYTLFTLTVSRHYCEPDIYVFTIGDIPLTIRPKEIYENKNSVTMIKYINMLERVYNYANSNLNYKKREMNTFIENISVFEILASKFALNMENSRDPKIVHNSLSFDQFLKQFDINFFWEKLLKSYSDNHQYIYFENPNQMLFIKGFLSKLDQKRIDILQDYLTYRILKTFGIYCHEINNLLSLDTDDIEEDDFNIELFYETFGPHLEKIYEEKYSNDAKNEAVYQIFYNMKSYCLDIFMLNTKFEENTKIEALKKISTLDIIVGKQNYRINLEKLPLLNNDFYANLMIINNYYFESKMLLIGRPIIQYLLSLDTDILSYNVNAYYEPYANILYIPTSMLDDLFLNLNADPIYNYGSIGSIIGHEIMHCFDTYGALFDHKGHYHNWWSEEDYKTYQAEIEKVKKHYSTLLINGTEINYESTVSENMADIYGLKLSLKTFIKNYLSNTNINNLSNNDKEYLKIFFKSWANTLRQIDNEENLLYDIKFDVHSPTIVRINAPFSHIDDYYEIYNVLPTHLNYLAPELRTRFF